MPFVRLEKRGGHPHDPGRAALQGRVRNYPIGQRGFSPAFSLPVRIVIPTGASALFFQPRVLRGWADAEWRDLLSGASAPCNFHRELLNPSLSLRLLGFALLVGGNVGIGARSF